MGPRADEISKTLPKPSPSRYFLGKSAGIESDSDSKNFMATIENSDKKSTVGTGKPDQTPIDALPRMEDLPGADVVIFDGHCNFCRRQVQRLNWFAGGSVAFLSLHDSRVTELCPHLSHGDLMQRMYVVTSDKRTFGGAAAVKYLSRRLPRLWFAAPLLHIPFTLPIWNTLYDWVARARYSIAGRAEDCESGACDVHFKKQTR